MPTAVGRPLALVDEETPDLILLDIMMPQMTGYEVCQRLRRTYNAAQLPVIMLTARSRVSDVVQGFQAGANDYVAKPFSRDILLARVRTQLQLGRAYQTLAENIRLKKELETTSADRTRTAPDPAPPCPTARQR